MALRKSTDPIKQLLRNQKSTVTAISTAPTITAAAAASTWVMRIKGADEIRDNTATVAADDGLTFSALAATMYFVRGRAFYTSDDTPDFKYSVLCSSAPTSAVGFTTSTSPNNTIQAADILSCNALPADVVILQAAGVSTYPGIVELDLVIVTNAATTVSFGWAQNTSDSADTTVLAGSYLEYRKVV